MKYLVTNPFTLCPCCILMTYPTTEQHTTEHTTHDNRAVLLITTKVVGIQWESQLSAREHEAVGRNRKKGKGKTEKESRRKKKKKWERPAFPLRSLSRIHTVVGTETPATEEQGGGVWVCVHACTCVQRHHPQRADGNREGTGQKQHPSECTLLHTVHPEITHNSHN